MTLRRGFKTEAEWFARELRRDLRVQPHAPISPWALADRLSIPVVPLSQLRPHAPQAIAFLMTRGRDSFSAVTIFVGNYGKSRVICHNDGNARTRQAADIAHELSHAILGHSPRQMFLDDPVAEDEAKWMGPTLLVPNEAARHVVWRGQSIEESALEFGVSVDLMRMRLNVSGALKRAKRLRRS
jgi:hypothetical protein